MTKSELCVSTFPKPLVGFSKSLGGPQTLVGIFQNPGWSFLPPPVLILDHYCALENLFFSVLSTLSEYTSTSSKEILIKREKKVFFL